MTWTSALTPPRDARTAPSHLLPSRGAMAMSWGIGLAGLAGGTTGRPSDGELAPLAWGGSGLVGRDGLETASACDRTEPRVSQRGEESLKLLRTPHKELNRYRESRPATQGSRGNSPRVA